MIFIVCAVTDRQLSRVVTDSIGVRHKFPRDPVLHEPSRLSPYYYMNILYHYLILYHYHHHHHHHTLQPPHTWYFVLSYVIVIVTDYRITARRTIVRGRGRQSQQTDMSWVTCLLNVGSNSKWRQRREWWVHQVPDSNVIKSVHRRLFHCLLHARIALDVARPLIKSWRAWVRLSCGATGA